MIKYTTHINHETGHEWIETDLTGKALLNNSLLNKGSAFSQSERVELGLLGKLPFEIESLEQQLERARHQYQRYPSILQKHIYLNNLHNKNEVLFYKLLTEDLAALLPLVYTPGIGSAVKEFCREFRQPRGLYIAYPDRAHMSQILDNRTHPDIDLIVVTDGEGVLGLGDQGIGGMDIPIAKSVLYTLCGVNPYRVLPIMLDVGTNNSNLLNAPMYLGWRQKRLQGADYDAYIEQFVKLIHLKFPNAFLHWEDFGRDNARRILEKYQHQHCMFNDDMQGTGVVTLAALLAAIGSTNVPLENQRIVVFGAGTAGIGIADQLCQAMVRCGLDPEEAKKRFWLMDRPGLLLKNMSSISEFQAVYARDSADIQDWPKQDNLDLLTVVKAVRPTILVGCSTLRNAFTQEVIWEMAQQVARPIIFPLSNPTENCEATPLNILQWTQGRALIASGSPFEPVTLGNHTFEISQCNNALSFPGIGLGIIATHATQLTDNMLWAATQALSELAPVRNQPGAPLLPKLKDLKKIAFHIAQRVAQQACDEGVAQIVPTQSMADHINSTIWQPFYRPIRRASERFK